jgi:hypothetical protein
VQPKGKSLEGHQSGIAYEKVPGIFAVEKAPQLYDTYSWIHFTKKQNIGENEMVKFRGHLVDRPEDSEGVVVKPHQVLERVPLHEWITSGRHEFRGHTRHFMGMGVRHR